QRARHDHAHRVIEVGAFHLLFDRDRRDVVRRLRRLFGRAGGRRRRKSRIVAQRKPGFLLVLWPRREVRRSISQPSSWNLEYQQKSLLQERCKCLILLRKFAPKFVSGKTSFCPQSSPPWRCSTSAACWSTGTPATSTASSFPTPWRWSD